LRANSKNLLDAQQVDRRILALAVPALGALVAEPLFVLADTAIVGHLGTAPLAALSLASTVLMTAVGLCVFLAYATTATVARLLGAGHRDRALQAGVDGIWLALGLGAVLAAVLAVACGPLLRLLGAEPVVVDLGTTYLRASAPGLPGMLVVLAATGVLRGLQNTRTPLVVAVCGAVANAVLNWVLVYGLHLGIGGSGAGTAVAQLGMAAALGTVVVRGARRAGMSLAPRSAGILAQARHGVPLFVRTLSLRAAILLTAAVAASLGEVPLAGHQVVMAVWNLVAFALDALAIAAQALVGHSLGAGDVGAIRRLLRRTLQWGSGAGAALGVLVAASAWWFVPLFAAGHEVRVAATLGLLVCGVLMPLAGVVFMLDGVLIGAGDGPYLAWAGIGTVLVYLPAAWAVSRWAPDGAAGLAWLWVAFAGVFLGARAVTTWLRARSDAWLVTGA